MSYTATAQAGTESEHGFTASQQIDLIGQWHAFSSPRFGVGALSFALEYIGTLGGVDASGFQQALGSSWLTNNFDTAPDSHVDQITFLRWDQWLFEERLQLAVGKLDPTGIVAQNAYLGDGQEFFLATPLAEDPVLPFYEVAGLGALARLTLGRFTGVVVASDATATSDGIDVSSAGDGKWQQALEVSWRPEPAGLGDGAYRLTVFHVPRVGSGSAAAAGWSFAASFDQAVGDDWGVFLYFSRAHGRVLELEQQLSTGVVLERPFGSLHDELGLGLTWGKPAERGRRNQLGVELYWRLQLTDRIELTPDLQLLRPADRGEDLEAVLGLRLRLFL